MAAAFSPERPGIDIPERPTAASTPSAPNAPDRAWGWSTRRRMVVAGGIVATALVVAMGALLLSGDERGAGTPGEAPLIKAEDDPIKVSPESPGGMQVPNRDIMVYGRLQGTPSGKPPVERLLPEPEQPLVPPSPRPPESATFPDSPPGVVPDEGLTDEGAPVDEPPSPAEPMPAPKPAPSAAPAAKPAPDKAAADKAAAQKAAAEKAKAQAGGKPATGAYQVQLFAGRSADEAKGAWARLKGKNGDLLGALSPTVARADLGDKGTFYRLRAGPLSSEAQARSLCQSLGGRGASCIIVRPGK